MNLRFTLDGSDALELQLGRTCARLCVGVQSIIPEDRLEGIVLGGGYGRGEGGVLRSDTGDLPYNDLEFYVFVRGPRFLNERRYCARLGHLAEDLSPPGLHAEFKIDSLEKLRQSPVSMFSYDLVAGHKIFLGNDSLFAGCQHHLNPSGIPLGEATRLLFNRCGGLLLAKGLFRTRHLSESEADFIGRNLAKAQLALGDAVLTAFGQYHWSCSRRHELLRQLALPEPPGWLDTVRAHHSRGVEFKLHPRRINQGVDAFKAQHEELAQLASQLWLWLESRRLSYAFTSPREYAFSRVEKCPETSGWRNYLLNLKTFGFRAGLDPCCCRYPRERLFNALTLLLWNGELTKEPAVKRHVQRQLHSDASDWPGLVAAFRQVWPSYG
jgi:hypothetical protein